MLAGGRVVGAAEGRHEERHAERLEELGDEGAAVHWGDSSLIEVVAGRCRRMAERVSVRVRCL